MFSKNKGLKAKLLRSGANSAAIHALNRLLALGSGVLLARALGTEGYGIYAYAFAVMNVIMILAVAGVPLMLMRDVAAGIAHGRWAVTRGVLIRGIQFVSLTSILVMSAGFFVVAFLPDDFDQSRRSTLIAMLLAVPIVSLLRAVTGSIKGFHRISLGQSLEILIQPALFLLAVGLVFFLSPESQRPELAMTLHLVTAATTLGIAAVTLFKVLPNDLRHAAAQLPPTTWLKSAVPFTLVGGAAIINNQADIIMLGLLRPVDEVGIYRVTSQGAMLVGFLLHAATAVVGPHFSSLYAKGDLERVSSLLEKTAKLVTLGALPIVGAFALFGSDILSFVFGAPFAAGWPVLIILSAGYLANASFGPVGMLLQMIGQEAATARALWLTALGNLALNAILIPAFGTVGAATSTAIAVTCYHFLLRRLIRSTIGI